MINIDYDIPLEEQLYKSPGRPLIVYASDTFGPPPVWRAWLITASGSAFHHSPAFHQENSESSKIWQQRYVLAKTNLHSIITKYNWNFLVRLFERVRFISPWQDDQRTVDCCPHPRNVSMPEEGTSLASDCEVIGVTLASLYRTLCYICRSISPTTP